MSWGETGFLAGKIDGIFDKTNYNTLLTQGTKTAPTAGFETLALINGNGYLSMISFTKGTASSSVELKITVDGTVVYLANTGANTTNFTLGLSELFTFNTSATAGGYSILNGTSLTFRPLVSPQTISKIPYTSNGNVIGFLSMPLLFSTSVKVEVLINGTLTVGGEWTIMGGVK